MGSNPLWLEARSVFWIVSSSLCPILVLLLLVVSLSSFDPATFALYREEVGNEMSLFVPIVAIVALGFVVLGIFMFRQMVLLPILELQRATRKINDGQFDVRIESNRTDEFGELARDFNRMAEGLREREHLRQVVDKHEARRLSSGIRKRSPGKL